jgi:hypothetical protein
MKTLVGIAAAPPVILGILALMGARDDVGVITTGAGPHAFVGAAWVVAWLATVAVSPGMTVGVVLAWVGERLLRKPQR